MTAPAVFMTAAPSELSMTEENISLESPTVLVSAPPAELSLSAESITIEAPTVEVTVEAELNLAGPTMSLEGAELQVATGATTIESADTNLVGILTIEGETNVAGAVTIEGDLAVAGAGEVVGDLAVAGVILGVVVPPI